MVIVTEDMHLPSRAKPVMTGHFRSFVTDYSYWSKDDCRRFGLAVWFIDTADGERKSIETQTRDDGYAVVLWTKDTAEETDALVLGKLTHIEHDERGLYLTFEKDGKNYRVDCEMEYGDPLTVCEEFDPEVLA